MAYSSPPGEETSREGITCQSAQPITYSSIKLNQADTCFYYLRQCYKFVLIMTEVARTVKNKVKTVKTDKHWHINLWIHMNSIRIK